MRESLAPLRQRIDETLDRLTSEDHVAPQAIREAVRYAVLGNGKRLRPVLVLASGRAVGGREEELLQPACALEMIHAFSLVHDDLPALDDDDLRRGRATVHVRFGEAVAVLAGDALLNLAFQTLARFPEGDAFAQRKIAAIGVLGEAVGLSGMIGGQAMDLEFEEKPASADEIRTIHRLKTGALITASCAAGGILGGGSAGQIGALERYGRALGLAFQITDDILDVEGTAEEIGKSPGKDQRAGKATFPSVHGLARSREMAEESVAEALSALDPFGEGGRLLAEIAAAVVSRRS
ncbi:MAG TPA: farnesyl diphosphate synthase [Candidatus Saccharimonadales bacterium]|nr:farnesyl diphosphate synthase [Candidatus Saccharimonadales bacterium]